MKILYILPEFYPHPGGGIATFYLNLLPQLVKKGVQPVVWIGSAFSAEDNADLEYENIPIRHLSKALSSKYINKFQHLDPYPELQKHLASAWALYEAAGQEPDIDLIETVDFGYGYLPWVLDEKRKVIVRMHGSCAQIEAYDPRTGLKLYADLLKAMEYLTLPLGHLITYSHNNQQFWESKLGKKSALIAPFFTQPESAPDSGLEAEPYALVTGRIQSWKGPQILCEALQKIKDPIKVYWIGRDTDYQKRGNSFSKLLSEKYPEIWGKRIVPIGARPHAETLQWMRNAQFGIVCSTWDMFNITAIEWLSMEKPLICSKGAGAWNIVEQAGGAVYPPEDQDQLSQLFVKYQSLGKEGLQRKGKIMHQKFKEQNITERLAEENIQFYQRVLHSSRPVSESDKTKWALSMVFPSEEGGSRETMMDGWPLKLLSRYTSKRMLRKLLEKK